MDAAIQFAEYVSRMRYEDLPCEVVEMVKMTFLDSLGVCVAGSVGPGVKEVVTCVTEWGGREESSVLVFGHRLPAPSAAFANGTMCRVLDYNETYDPGRTHPTVSVVPTALAVAESTGRKNGKDFITALALAFDVHCRLSSAAEPGHWLTPQLDGFFSATIAAGKLYGLTEKEIIDALGIAYCQVSGGRQSTTERVVTRGLQGAFASKGGILSAVLAQKGITGPKQSLEGKNGFFNAYHGGHYDREILLGGLGSSFDFFQMSYKAYPSCRQLHASIDAALHLVQDRNILAKDVEEVLVYAGDFVQTTFEPLEEARNPLTVIESQFSGPYVISTVIVKRKITLNDFIGTGFRDPEVLQFAQKVNYKPYPEFSKRMEPGQVEIRLRDGQRFLSKRVDFAKGHPANPMTHEDFVAKFRDCNAYSAKPIEKERVERIIETIENLERIGDMREFMVLLQ